MRKTPLVLALAALGFASSAFATNGYFSHGYGMKAKGMGGAATAMTHDTFGGANNPASMVWVGDRIDLGADLFSPRRYASRSGSAGGAIDGDVNSDSNYFIIPEFGYNRMLRPDMAIGVTVYGNGGMNTDYSTGQLDAGICAGGPPNGNPANLLCGNGSLGVDLMQLIIAPTLSYKVSERHSIGIAPLLGYQRFSAEGLEAFTASTSNPNGLTDNHHDSSTGFGVRVGWLGKLSDTVTLGAAYASKMSMSEFDEYDGLFAEQGDFDIPSNWNIGLAVQATPKLKVALDYQRINYTDIKSISNPSSNILLGNPLGADNGSGFGWRDVDVWKLGVEFQYSKSLTLRAGYNHGDNPIRREDVTFNILAPGVVQDHVTLGFTYVTASGGELTVSYMHAFSETVTGTSLLGTISGAGGSDKIKMHQDALGVAYSWKL